MNADAARSAIGPGRSSFGVRLGAYLAAILLIAGMVHIVTVLMVPYFAEGDGWSRLSENAPHNMVVTIDDPSDSEEILPGLDPLFLHAYCRVSIEQEPARLTFSAPVQFWSLALYNRNNSVIFSLNDRTIEQGKPEIVIVTPAQNARLKQNDPDRFSQSIVLNSDQPNVVAMLRFYAPTDRDRRETADIMSLATCGPLGEGESDVSSSLAISAPRQG